MEIQRSKSEFESWRTLVLLTSVQNGDEGVVAACMAGVSGRSEDARLAGAWWRRISEGRTKTDFRIYVDALHKIKGECRQVWDVIRRWAEAYFKVTKESCFMMVCPTDGSTSFNYATVMGSALYKMAQAEAGLAEGDLFANMT